MSNNLDKPKLNKEQIEALMKQLTSQGGNKITTPNQSKFSKYFNQFLVLLSKLVKYIDRFINFIVRQEDSNRNDVVQHSRAPIIFGTYTILIFFGIGFIWAATAPLYSAAGAGGVLINDSHRQLIQNAHGGIVKGIYVKLGDKVKKGQKLLEIEDIQHRTKYEQNLNNYRNLIASLARLDAEKDDLEEIIFPEELMKDQDNLEVKKIIDNQIKLFRARTESYKSLILSLEQKKEQFLKQLDSLISKKNSLVKQLKYYQTRSDAQRKLLQDGHTTKANAEKSEIDYEAYKNESFTNENEISKLQQALLQDESEINHKKSAHLSEVLKEIRENTSTLYNTKEDLKSSKDALDKEVIVSPVDGTVNVINVHTVGGYISSHLQQGAHGAAIMEITPDNEKLIIDAKIPQSKIANVHVGLDAVIRFGAFKSRTSPSFKGKVVAMSSDSVEDPKAMNSMPTKGLSDDSYFYPAKIEIDMEDFNRLTKGKDLQLKPGMRADIMIITGKRTLIRYLLDPMTDTLFKAFNEK